MTISRPGSGGYGVRSLLGSAASAAFTTAGGIVFGGAGAWSTNGHLSANWLPSGGLVFGGDSTFGGASGLITVAISYANSDSTIPVFDVGDTVRIYATYRDGLTDALIDPTSVVFWLRAPGGSTGTLAVTRESAGVYHAELTIAVAGRYHFQWQAPNQDEDGQFTVKTSLVH